MGKADKNQKGFDNRHTDIRAEIIYAFLRGKSKRVDDPVFFPVGAFKRRFRRDVSNLVPKNDFKYNLKKPVLEVHRNGLYDLFPEFLFHRNKKRKPFKTVEELKEESEFNRKIEQTTRKLFWPLDHYLLKARVMIALSEDPEIGQGGSDRATGILDGFWNIPDFFDVGQKKMLRILLSMAKTISANLEWMSQSLSLIINEKVEVSEKWVLMKRSIREVDPLGVAELGSSTFCGNGSEQIVRKLFIAVGPVRNSSLVSFIENEINERRLRYLLNYFIPADTEVEVKLIPPRKKPFKLSDKREDVNILGVSTILNPSV